MAQGGGGAGRRPRVLLGATGSVASVKLPLLVARLLALPQQPEVRVVCTEHAKHFFAPESLPVPVYSDADEWQTWTRLGDPVLHVDLRRWADLLLLAPLDANSLAKVAGGLCDNLLMCVVRAWDRDRPLLFCPAMNTHMWDHPLTGAHTRALRQLGYEEVACVSKTLACGDTGCTAPPHGVVSAA
ncbi:phosphopantothenoylcysteine decarboxylase-like isoform X2 [Petromyzon marinus]|uniref:phosphopantothenoylcysteine decarboxylase isoform X2 n=1 Tax=Petromyzon marinus TaxID=7757 RepID=UPI003F721C46